MPTQVILYVLDSIHFEHYKLANRLFYSGFSVGLNLRVLLTDPHIAKHVVLDRKVIDVNDLRKVGLEVEQLLFSFGDFLGPWVGLDCRWGVQGFHILNHSLVVGLGPVKLADLLLHVLSGLSYCHLL